MNKIFLSGNLTREPDFRYTPSGKAYARFGIAVNRPYSQDKAVDFFNVTAWDKSAELIGKFAKKGSRLLIDGRLQTSKYTNKDGVEVQSVEVVVENFEFAGSKKDAPPKDDFGGEPIPPDDTPF